MPDQKDSNPKLIKQIQDINGNPAFSEEEKKVEIAKLQVSPSHSTRDSKKKL